MQLNGYAAAEESEADHARKILADMGICYPPGFTTERLGQVFENWAAANGNCILYKGRVAPPWG